LDATSNWGEVLYLFEEEQHMIPIVPSYEHAVGLLIHPYNENGTPKVRIVKAMKDYLSDVTTP